jgi:hypothetical protein
MVMNSDAKHRKEFSTENTLGGDFLFPEPTAALFRRGDSADLCATTPLAALFGPKCNRLRSSKPGRQFMRIETDCPSQSKGWKSPACRHFIDMLGCDLEQFCNVPCAQNAAFFFQLIYQTHIRAPQQKTILPLTRMQSRLFKAVRAFRQTASSCQVPSGG